MIPAACDAGSRNRLSPGRRNQPRHSPPRMSASLSGRMWTRIISRSRADG